MSGKARILFYWEFVCCVVRTPHKGEEDTTQGRRGHHTREKKTPHKGENSLDLCSHKPILLSFKKMLYRLANQVYKAFFDLAQTTILFFIEKCYLFGLSKTHS
jgi:hypothetical protein